MTRLPKLLATAAAALAVAFTVQAETAAGSRFNATIDIARGASAEVTFNRISAQVARACRKELQQNGRVDLGVASRFKAQCKAELMADAVEVINDPVLTAYYNGSQTQIRQMASR